LQEESVLSPTPKAAVRPLLYMAELRGMGEIPSPRRIELWPYLSTALELRAGEHELVPHAGGDALIGLGSVRTLHLSCLPDFGDVESDPSQLNLTAFEVFLPEKRPLFLESREAFRWRTDTTKARLYSIRGASEPNRPESFRPARTKSVTTPRRRGSLARRKPWDAK
jgi:hypothetical protein